MQVEVVAGADANQIVMLDADWTFLQTAAPTDQIWAGLIWALPISF